MIMYLSIEPLSPWMTFKKEVCCPSDTVQCIVEFSGLAVTFTEVHNRPCQDGGSCRHGEVELDMIASWSITVKLYHFSAHTIRTCMFTVITL